MDRFGVLTLIDHPLHGLTLTSTETEPLDRLVGQPDLVGKFGRRLDAESVLVHPSERGELKHALLQLGHPVSDHAGYVDGEAHDIVLSDDAHGGQWHLRDYQREAIDQSLAGGVRGRRPPLRGGQDRRRGRDDVAGADDDAHPRDELGLGEAVGRMRSSRAPP